MNETHPVEVQYRKRLVLVWLYRNIKGTVMPYAWFFRMTP
jgi:hypothetical protein